MKKTLALCCFCLLNAWPAAAQLTTVSGTIRDVNGIAYSNAQLKMQLVTTAGSPVTGQPTVTVNNQAQCVSGGFGSAPCQVPFQGTVGPFQVSPSGSFTINLQDNTLVTPAATQWLFTANSLGVPPPLGTGPQVCTLQSTISGATQTPSFFCPALGNAAGTPQVVQNGLMADYQMQPYENPCALVDYSGNGRNATGCDGTPPTIITPGGGVNFNNNGGIILSSSLNSALSIMFYFSFQSNGNRHRESLLGDSAACCNSTTQIALYDFGDGVFTTMRATSFVYRILVDTTNSPVGSQQDIWNGTGSFTITMAASNHYYINGTEIADYGSGAILTSAGLMTAGSYQLGGSTVNADFFTGKMYRAIFYNRVLSAAEVAYNHGAVAAQMAARGVPVAMGLISLNGLAPPALFAGDSITYGAALTTPWPAIILLTGAPGNFNIINQGLPGQVTTQLANAQATLRDTMFSQNPNLTPNGQGANNLTVIWAGTNDGQTAAVTGANINSYCTGARKVGWKCGVITMISRTGVDATKDSLNPVLRAIESTNADFLIDIGGTTQLGADGANANATWFQGDAIHPNQNAAFNFLSPVIQMVINRFFGHRNFATATTYSSAAPAAVATTSGSEAGNGVTINFAGGSTCLTNILCTCTGITPAGYNQTYFASPGTATQLSAFNPTSGLGAITVQGTCSSPQQQDADQYIVLNFGAGNFTLQTCQGFTGQNLYIKNINAASSTLVAFPAQTGTNTPWTAETFDGAATLAIAQNQVRILQSQLVSQAAGGCTWKIIQ